jgi:hypothetical protein
MHYRHKTPGTGGGGAAFHLAVCPSVSEIGASFTEKTAMIDAAQFQLLNVGGLSALAAGILLRSNASPQCHFVHRR